VLCEVSCRFAIRFVITTSSEQTLVGLCWFHTHFLVSLKRAWDERTCSGLLSPHFGRHIRKIRNAILRRLLRNGLNKARGVS
jgi:hypothetical protein